MAALNLKVGQTIETGDSRQGTIRYIGTLHIAAGEWCGLELPDASGKNDGSVKGERYFDCQPGHGIFVRKESVMKVLKQPTTSSIGAKTNGAGTGTSISGAAKSRPSTVTSGDAAKKRQSLMNAGSQPSSRLSMRSPTRSPIKPAVSSASSTTSTPRTGTPATTARTSDSSAKSRLSTTGRSSMGPPATKPKPAASATRPSVGGTISTAKTSRPSAATGRTSTGTSRLSTPGRPVVKRPTSESPSKKQGETAQSPTIEEDDEEEDAQVVRSEQEDEFGPSTEPAPAPREKPPETTSVRMAAKAPVSRPSGNNAAEARAAQQKENEQLKVKIRNLEKKRQDDLEKLQQIDVLQSDKDRFEGIIQALQKKLKSNQEELKELRAKCEEAESRLGSAPERSAEFESELELATLDKEMAEERADSMQLELDELKARNEELELEMDVLRGENNELASTMSPEERANAGVLHLERESERLREALILLRDQSRVTEGDLKAEIKDLQQNLDEVQETASRYTDTMEKLTRLEETNRHLMDQLEAAESNEEVVEAMETQREQQRVQIESLRHQVQELEEHVQVTDELEHFHVDEEKRLNARLDEQEALLNDQERKAGDQEKIIEDLEYTLGKFRSVVQGLQSDIDEARRSREISELQAHEMSSKSRAMMDLNLRLQNSAAKSQTKTVDIEMGKVMAELATRQVEIISLFLPQTYESERNPVLAYLSFGRLKSKAALVVRMLSERLRERGHLSSGEEIIAAYEALNRLECIEAMADRFERFMMSCSTPDFAACGNANYELEPVERAINSWIEALRRDELGSDGPEHLMRMQGILVDLAEKRITESAESKANELVARSKMIEAYSESTALLLAWLSKFVQTKLGPPRDEDEEHSFFDNKMDQLGTKARTMRFLCGKITQELDRIRSSSMCLGETVWAVFEEIEQQAASFATQIRSISAKVVEDVTTVEREEPLSYSTVISAMNKTSSARQSDDDVFTSLTLTATSLQNQIDVLANKSTDLSSAIEFEPNPAPWVIRAREIKAQKIISNEIQEELAQLQRRNGELIARINDKERTIEEMTIRVELAERRMKDSRQKDQQDKAVKDEVERLRSEKEHAELQLAQLQATMTSTRAQMDKDRQELELLRQGADLSVVKEINIGKVDETVMKHMKAAIKSLENEITGLQSSVRYLRRENRELQIPVQTIRLQAAKDSWLDPANLQRGKASTSDQRHRDSIRREICHVEDNLIEVAKNLKPIQLRSGPSTTSIDKLKTNQGKDKGGPLPTLRRSVKETTRYQVFIQREEIEKWNAWKEDLLRQAKLTRHTQQGPQMRRLRRPVLGLKDDLKDGDDVGANDGIKIIEA